MLTDKVICFKEFCTICDIKLFLTSSFLAAPKLLGKRELKRYTSFGSEKRKMEFLKGRFAIKKLVMGCFEKSNIDYTDIEINSDYTAPMLYIMGEKREDIFISLSHSGEFALAAVSFCKIGVDIQENRKLSSSLINRFLNKSELVYKNEAIALWSVKEAVMKLFGKGIKLGFKNIRIVDFEYEKVKELFCKNESFLYYCFKYEDYIISIVMQPRNEVYRTVV